MDVEYFEEASVLVRDGILITYQHFHFVEILGLAVAVLDLFGEDKVELKQEHPTLPGLTNQFFRVPYMEGVLKFQMSDK